jgi:microcystin-dependent protein
MSNVSSTPAVPEAINGALARLDVLERQPVAWTKGQIIMWYGAIGDIPTGWWPCDGTAAPDGVTTPDLRGRVPVGLKTTDADFDTLGETGGGKTANLQHVHAGPSHAHTIDHDHPTFTSGQPSTTSNRADGANPVASETHTHEVNVPSFAEAAAPIPESGPSGTANTGTALSTTQSILPPFAVLHFIYRYQ